jgi:mannose-6-phosphate isomerase-like protein (cupin superfamily)
MTEAPPSTTREASPTKVKIDNVPVDEQTESFRQVRLIGPDTGQSNVVLGLQWFDGEGEPVSWTADAKTHEVYYVGQGKILITWNGPDSGSAGLSTGDAFFLAPGRSYSVRAAGGHPAFVVWALSPPDK